MRIDITCSSFDKFAPLGPVIVSSKVHTSDAMLTSKLIPNPNNLILQTRINGEIRQSTSTADMLFDIPTLIAFLSQGTTLEARSIIMTGTPEGVNVYVYNLS
jgi:2-keto-4-pentenoate hydratase/2-oxohepta-3-ene-1,7-dioic acid hydratase in catechol pathway